MQHVRAVWGLALLSAPLLYVPAATLAADPPGPYVALRVEYFEDRPGSNGVSSALPDGEQRGSGVVIAKSGADGWLVLTNAHVVEHGDGAGRTEPNVYAGGRWRAGKVLASDAEADLALVRIAFPTRLRTTPVAALPPDDGTVVQTHGFSSGKKYTLRKSKVRHSLPLPEGGRAVAPQRYFLKTKFTPGESGGAVVQDGRLVGLIHGNDLTAGWGLTVDQPSIATFVEPFLKASHSDPPRTAPARTAPPRVGRAASGLDAIEPIGFKPRVR